MLCGYFGFSWVFLNERKWHRVLSSQPLVRCYYICRRIRRHLGLSLPCWYEDLGLNSGPHSALRQVCHWCEKEHSTFPVWSPNTPNSIGVPVQVATSHWNFIPHSGAWPDGKFSSLWSISGFLWYLSFWLTRRKPFIFPGGKQLKMAPVWWCFRNVLLCSIVSEISLHCFD